MTLSSSEETKGPSFDIRKAYCKVLSIFGVGLFEDGTKISFCHPAETHPSKWTVILGDNNIGKTLLLQMIAACDRDGQDLAAQYFERMSQETTILDLEQLRFEMEFSYLNRDYSIVKLNLDTQRGRPKFRNELDVIWTCLGYGVSRRIVRSALDDERSKRLERCESLFTDQYPLLDPEAWLVNLDIDIRLQENPAKQPLLEKQFDQIKKVLCEILPEVEAIEIRERKVFFRTKYGTFSLKTLSAGYTAMLVWVIDLARRLLQYYPESLEPLAQPIVVLVDEIDLHLHPRWQLKLAEKLQKLFPNAQFIVTAHSPLIVLADPQANLIRLRREGVKVVVDHPPPFDPAWRADQVLTQIMELESARAPAMQRFIDERDALLALERLNPDEEQRLQELDQQIGPYPLGENTKEMQLFREIHQALTQKAKAK